MQDDRPGDRKDNAATDGGPTHPDESDAPSRRPDGPEANQPPTTSRLRGDIDEGRAGDKVGFPDPAASPLGTDAEAGGTSPTPDEVARAQANETRDRPQAPSPGGARPVSSGGADRRRGRGVATVAVLAGVVVVIVLLALVI